MYVCLMHIFLILIHVAMMHIYMMHDACIYTWSWYMHVWCMYICPSILDPGTCIHVWCIHLLSVILTHVCMMHVFMMRHICHAWTNLDSDAYIHDACMHDAYTYAPWSLCICAWCINVWCIHPWSLILDYAACVYDAAEILFRTNERTDEQGDSRSRMKGKIFSIWLWWEINSQSLEDTQVGYISQNYTLDKYTLERASSPVHRPQCITPGA